MAPSSLPSPAPGWGCRGGSPRCPGQNRGVGLVQMVCSKVERMLHTGGSAHRVKLLWSLRSCLERVWNSSKQMLAVGEHSVFCALMVFSLNKSRNPSSGGQAPRCTSLPCVWQEQRAFSKLRFPTVTAAKPGQEMSGDTKLHFLFFFFIFISFKCCNCNFASCKSLFFCWRGWMLEAARQGALQERNYKAG